VLTVAHTVAADAGLASILFPVDNHVGRREDSKAVKTGVCMESGEESQGWREKAVPEVGNTFVADQGRVRFRFQLG
jgi:hypothetical protein